MATALDISLKDLEESAARLPLAVHLAWQDVRLRYARSVIGPFWVSISILVTAWALSFVMTGLFGGDVKTALPFVLMGIIIWSFASQSMIEACTVLIAARGHLTSSPIPYAMMIFSALIRNCIISLHHLVAFAFVALVVGVHLSLATLLIIPGMILLLLSTCGIVFVIACLTPRFRDILPLVSMVMGIGALLSPVYWRPELLVKNRLVAVANPMTYLLDVVRAPLIGEATLPHAWQNATITALVCISLGFAVFAFTRRRLPLWI
jgi:ABC-type polysaccharide/polyol phosphate export permease